MSDEVKHRAEKLWLMAESLERHLNHQGASTNAVSLVADVVVAARELYNELAAPVPVSDPEGNE